MIIDLGILRWTVRAITRIVAAYAIVQGINIALTPRGVWEASPPLTTALNMPGAPLTWGVMSIIAGTVALVGSLLHRHLIVATGMYLCAGWSLYFAVTLGVSWWSGQTTPRTGLVTYTAFGLVQLVIGAAYRTSRS